MLPHEPGPSTGGDDRTFTVRNAAAEDAVLLAELGARTFRDTFGPDNTDEDMAQYLASAFGPGVQARELADADGRFIICSSGSEPAGYARLLLGSAPSCIAGEHPVEIVRFYADTPWIGRGAGSAIMRACLDAARDFGADVIWLDVWERNPRAIAFYRKWGFEVVGAQDFVLGTDVQRDLLMARPVS